MNKASINAWLLFALGSFVFQRGHQVPEFEQNASGQTIPMHKRFFQGGVTGTLS